MIDQWNTPVREHTVIIFGGNNLVMDQPVFPFYIIGILRPCRFISKIFVYIYLKAFSKGLILLSPFWTGTVGGIQYCG